MEQRRQILQDKVNNPFIHSEKLASKYNISISALNSFLHANHASTKELTGITFRKYSANDKYFSKIDSHDKAYLLGVWYSDGYLVKEGPAKTKRIGLETIDEDWLEDISKELESEAPLYKTAKENLKRLKITSPYLYNDLIKLGCIENKTLKLKFPTKEQVPTEFVNSFILGLFDGDGSIIIGTPRKETWSPEVKLSLTGTKEIVNGVQDYFNLHLKLDQRWPDRNVNNYTLQITGIQQCAKILKILYKDAPSFCLKRKYEKYLTVINDSRVKS